MAAIYEIITARILEKPGVISWQRPSNAAAGCPRNVLSQKEYRNTLVKLEAYGGLKMLACLLSRRRCQNMPAILRLPKRFVLS